MKISIDQIVYGAIGYMLCWLPVVVAVYEYANGNGPWAECFELNWSTWWQAIRNLQAGEK